MSWSPREKRMLRAMRHLMHKNHNLMLTCDGCKEVAVFLTVPGDYPTSDDYFVARLQDFAEWNEGT